MQNSPYICSINIATITSRKISNLLRHNIFLPNIFFVSSSSICKCNTNTYQSLANYSKWKYIRQRVYLNMLFMYVKQFLRVEKSSINNASFFFIEVHQGFFEKIQGTLNTRTQTDRTVFWRAQNIQFSSHKAACLTLHLIEHCDLTTKEGLI